MFLLTKEGKVSSGGEVVTWGLGFLHNWREDVSEHGPVLTLVVLSFLWINVPI